MSIPPVRRIVFFKHGLAYVERSGPCDGSFELSFRRDEMKDVLKSLAVWVASGDARPRAIAFEKPEDPEAALAEKGLSLPAHRTLSGLLSAFRGRCVELRAGDETIRGEILGLESQPAERGRRRQVLAICVERGTIRAVDLERVVALRIEDPVAAANLDFLLDRRRAASASERRTVHVGVEGRAEDLRVAYVVPAPVWRVSYRIARDQDATLLAAWAIVHNPLDEDVREISLTLTTGQPISFDIDLYRPKTVRRVVVEESSRAAASPVQYEKVRPTAARAFGPPPAPAASSELSAAELEAAAPAMGADRLLQSAEGAAKLGDRGELFEYRIARPITLPRGGSALVPLFAAKVPASRERIWRVGSPTPAPDVVIALRNDTAAVLEEGPAVVYDEGVYAGEAMVPYTARGSEVKVAYAKDLAVRCRHEIKTRFVIVGVRLADQFVAEEQMVEDRHLLRAESDHDEPIEIVFEVPRRSDRRLAEDRGSQPFEETASFRRFRAQIPPRSAIEIEHFEIGQVSRRMEYASLSPAQLERWLRAGVLEGQMRDGLGEIVSAWAEASAHERRIGALEQERSSVYDGQSRIAEQLGVLRAGGPEGELRLRYAQELAKAQDRVHAIDREIAACREAADTARRRAETRLATLLGCAPA